nr:poly(ADP-ribose) glycohydrolase 1-like isoform X1 [Tanacetum cinerariifolium]
EKFRNYNSFSIPFRGCLEKFFHGKQVLIISTMYQACQGHGVKIEEHFGNGNKVHNYGKSTTGESWDIVVDGETYYECSLMQDLELNYIFLINIGNARALECLDDDTHERPDASEVEIQLRNALEYQFGEILPAMANLLLRLPSMLEAHCKNEDSVTCVGARDGFQASLRVLKSQEAGIILLNQATLKTATPNYPMLIEVPYVIALFIEKEQDGGNSKGIGE